MLWRALFGCVLVVISATAGWAQDPVLRAIEIRSDGDLGDLEEVRELFTVAVGEALTESAVRRSLVNLQVSGLASEVALYQRPQGDGGVVLVAVLWANLQVEAVEVVGEIGALRREELLAALPQRAGEPLVESRLVRGVYRLQDLFLAAGYRSNRVVLAPEIDDQRKVARIVYRVEAGPRTLIESVRFLGELGSFGDDDLLAELRQRPGSPLLEDRLPEDADRLEGWLFEQGYRQALVRRPTVTTEGEGAVVSYQMRVGPLVRVEVVGVESRELERKGLLPFAEGEGYDEALLLLTEDRLRTHFQRRGHYRVQVTTEEEEVDGEWRIRFTIDPGPVLELTEVGFRGNESFSDERLARLIKTSPKGFLALGSGRLVETDLAADLANLRSFYALEGFTRVRIANPGVTNKDDRLTLVIPIDEGPRQEVGSIDFEGFPLEILAAVRDELEVYPGGPFHPQRLRRSLSLLREAFERLGHERLQLSAEEVWNDDQTRVDLTLQVIPGPRTVVDRVLVRGNRRSSSAAILRVAALSADDPASLSNLREAERRLLRLGVFRRVRVERMPAALGSEARDVVIRVEEGKARRIAYGAGYDSEAGLGGLFSFVHSNLTGRFDSFSINARVQQESQQFSLFLDRPRGQRLPLTFSAFWIEEALDLRSGPAEDFELTRRGARVETFHDFAWGRAALSAGYRRVENQVPADLRPADEPFAREDQTLRLSSLVASLQIDRRDDPLNPSSGWSSILRLERALPVEAIDTEADFLEVFLQQTYYQPLGKAGVLAGSVRLGGIEPYSDLDIVDPVIPPELGLPSSEIFIAERFFAGGSSTHRAFRRDRLGIADETLFPGDDASGDLIAAGGNGLLLVNLDYRFPIAGPLQGAIFFDTGNVWADWRDIESSDLRSGAGVGLRYLSPIGPLRIEVGWPFDKLPGDSDVAVGFGLGTSF